MGHATVVLLSGGELGRRDNRVCMEKGEMGCGEVLVVIQNEDKARRSTGSNIFP